jgi:hypothetical protein
MTLDSIVPSPSLVFDTLYWPVTRSGCVENRVNHPMYAKWLSTLCWTSFLNIYSYPLTVMSLTWAHQINATRWWLNSCVFAIHQHFLLLNDGGNSNSAWAWYSSKKSDCGLLTSHRKCSWSSLQGKCYSSGRTVFYLYIWMNIFTKSCAENCAWSWDMSLQSSRR